MSCTVTLKILAESTAWGETIGVAGSLPQLSLWGTTTPPSMTASPFPTWTLSLTLPAETLVQYKYVILSSSEIARWEVLPASEENRSFTTPAPGETLEIDDGIMGDSARKSATVTPSTTPVNTPTKPQKPKTSTATTNESPEPTTEHDHPLAEYAAQLDNSRRQVEHVRAAVRRIRRIPTPDALPTPPSTPDQRDLSPDCAAALTNDALSDAKANVEVIRDKLRSVRKSRSKTSESSSNAAAFAGLLSFAVALLAVCIVIVDPRIGNHVRQAVINCSETVVVRVKEWWETGRIYVKNAAVTGRDWGEKVKADSEEVVDRAMTAAKAVEHPKLERLWEGVASAKQACRDAGSSVREAVGKMASRINQLRSS